MNWFLTINIINIIVFVLLWETNIFSEQPVLCHSVWKGSKLINVAPFKTDIVLKRFTEPKFWTLESGHKVALGWFWTLEGGHKVTVASVRLARGGSSDQHV